MKKLLLLIVLISGILFTTNLKSQTWLSSTSISCDWNTITNQQENCKTVINPVSITIFNDVIYLVDLNSSTLSTYNGNHYTVVTHFDSYIVTTEEYTAIFTITDEFILLTLNEKKTNKTYLNYYFID